MEKTITKVASAATLSLCMALPATGATFTDRFTSYYAFGDSLTDDGKLPLQSPISDGGRFSNGPTYAEIVEDQFIAAGRDTGNLALGGATGGPVNIRPINILSTFAGQIGVFQNAIASTLSLPGQGDPIDPGDNPLISVLFGGNDFFQGQNMTAAADFVAHGIRALAGTTGGMFNDFLVATLPNIGNTPAFAFTAPKFATQQTIEYNDRLRANILDLKDEGLNIHVFNSDKALLPVLDDIAAGGPLFGVLDALTPCTADISVDGPVCDNPDAFLFADAVHPNAVAQRVTGEAVAATLAAIPVPAGLPLMLVGLGALAFVRRRAA